MASPHRHRRLPPGGALQLVLTMLVLIGVVATPRASGAMILLPIAGSSLGEAVTITAAAGGRVLAHGPVPGSVVVIGERRRLLGPLLAHGILVAAAPRSWCAA